MIIHICPPVRRMLWIWFVLWQGVNWLGPAVCVSTRISTNVCVCIYQRVDSVGNVRASQRSPGTCGSPSVRGALLWTRALCLLRPVPSGMGPVHHRHKSLKVQKELCILYCGSHRPLIMEVLPVFIKIFQRKSVSFLFISLCAFWFFSFTWPQL